MCCFYRCPPPPAGPIYDTLLEMKAEMQRYGHYEVLVVDSVLKIVSSTLGVIYVIDFMGREYHCRLLQIAINVTDCAARLHNNLEKHVFLVPPVSPDVLVYSWPSSGSVTVCVSWRVPLVTTASLWREHRLTCTGTHSHFSIYYHYSSRVFCTSCILVYLTS